MALVLLCYKNRCLSVLFHLFPLHIFHHPKQYSIQSRTLIKVLLNLKPSSTGTRYKSFNMASSDETLLGGLIISFAFVFCLVAVIVGWVATRNRRTQARRREQTFHRLWLSQPTPTGMLSFDTIEPVTDKSVYPSSPSQQEQRQQQHQRQQQYQYQHQHQHSHNHQHQHQHQVQQQNPPQYSQGNRVHLAPSTSRRSARSPVWWKDFSAVGPHAESPKPATNRDRHSSEV